MSTTLLDRLARILATPMPRRQAVKTLSATIATAAFPGLFSTPPGGERSTARSCPAEMHGCGSAVPCCIATKGKGQFHVAGCLGPGDTCCSGPNQSTEHPDVASWICRGGSKCGASFLAAEQCYYGCPANETRCGSACCKANEACDRDRYCIPADCVEGKCGMTCCNSESYCASPNRSLCCKKGEEVCAVPQSPKAECCPPGRKCCFNEKQSNCCLESEVCKNGDCCPKDSIDCGGDCCAKNGCLTFGKKKACCGRNSVATPTGCCRPHDLSCCLKSVKGKKVAKCAPGQLCLQGLCY